MVPPPRSGAASVVVKGRLYVFGGYGGGTGRLDDFFQYSFETGQWDEVKVLSEAKPGRRENNGVVISDSSRSIYLFGGYNGSSWLNDLWKFDIESQRWTCIQESSDPDRADDANAASGDVPTGHQVRGKAPSRRFGYVSVVHEGKFVLFGGFDGSRWLNDMFEFDFSTKTWSEIDAKGSLPSVRSCPAWAKDETHVYIQGGYDGVERKADFFACDLATYTWTELPCYGTPPSPRYFHSCCLYGNKMYCYGGYSGSERLADMFAYDFETNHWVQVDCSSGDAPSGRSSLVAQVYENCLYVFGGYNGATVLNDFYKFRLKPILMPPPTLVNDFSRMINNPDLSDVRFLVEGKDVFAHRSVLAFRSEYFRVMLCGGMRESLARQDAGTSCVPSHDLQAIDLPNVSHLVFLKVLEFLYTDSVKDVSLETGIYLLIASEQFMLDRLKALCEDLIRRDIQVENVIGILAAAHSHHAAGLKDIALEYIMRNLNDPVIMAGLADLKSEPDLLLEIIQRNTSTSPTTRTVGSGGFHGIADGPFGGGSEWSASR
jgi:N-acetylneuraminic acid mutarotase